MNTTMSRGQEPAHGHATDRDGEWHRELAEASGDVFFVIRLAPDRAVEFMSDNVESQVGYPAEQFLADPGLLTRCVDPHDAADLDLVLTSPPGRQEFQELRWIHRDGHRVFLQNWIRTRERDDGSVVLEGTSHDITALREVERMKTVFEERYRLMAESANIVLWTMGLDGSITYVSPTVEQMRGFTVEEAMNQPLDEILTPDSQLIVADYYARLFADMAQGRVPEPFRCEQEYLCKDGSTIWTEVEVIPYLAPDGSVSELLGITRDIRDRKHYLDELKASRDEVAVANAALQEANEALHRLAVTDPLTGVWNRRHAEQVLTADLAESRRYGAPMSMLLLDIDHFKEINDTHGHLAGDRVLIELTRRLDGNLRASDALTRWGGDEFIILTHHCSLAEATGLADKLCTLVAADPFDVAGPVSVSVGVAELTSDDTLDSWLSRADTALYAAKGAGRNTVRAQA
ncbi:MAG: diguanylate cyclase [Actinobacteria bacterium]|nr:diguanylate cyclase [Actinomycetota bacterium]